MKVTVKAITNYPDSPFAQTIWEDTQKRIAADIEQRLGHIECPEHHTEPVIEMVEESENRGKLRFVLKDSCCEKLTNLVEARLAGMKQSKQDEQKP